MSDDDLISIPPQEAVDLHLDSLEDTSADWTETSHRSHLRAWVEWCREEGGIDSMDEVTGRDIYEFRRWRRNGGYSRGEDEIAARTIHTALSTLRAFLRTCASIEAVREDLFEKVQLPTLSRNEQVSDSWLPPERVQPILDYLSSYEYASRDHVIWVLVWHTGARLGAVRALDLGDVELDGDEPGLKYRHRPETGTPLKNNDQGERYNRISRRVARVLQDYIEGPRVEVTDDHGRTPLVTTKHGRLSPTCIRNAFYRWTRPCKVNEECPHDENPDTCEYARHTGMSSCPSARSTHDVRKGRVTKYRNDGVPRGVVADRLDCSEEILDKHYDRANEREKADRRWEFIDDE
ncbi:tyrosine-type recombinase/integrase [Halosimplex amylolyticum]|uniref:tyrosine-type recombinase/integrase n=1 Tax=Halosimplex amylolyticum TaxID=3396616 RepID=UPI003F54570B